VRERTRARLAASSTVTIQTDLPHELHQDCVCSLRPLSTTVRSVSMVISVRFFVANCSPKRSPAAIDLVFRPLYILEACLRNLYDGKALTIFLSSAVVALTLTPISW
jgi:hypothetical protein